MNNCLKEICKDIPKFENIIEMNDNNLLLIFVVNQSDSISEIIILQQYIHHHHLKNSQIHPLTHTCKIPLNSRSPFNLIYTCSSSDSLIKSSGSKTVVGFPSFCIFSKKLPSTCCYIHLKVLLGSSFWF